MPSVESGLLRELENAQSVLIAGAGGGFDVFCGLPLYFKLRARRKPVALANLSFTNLAEVRGPRIAPHVVEIAADSEGPEHYFPERALARWMRARGDDARIFAFNKVGVRPLAQAYGELQQRLGFDAVVLVDGGTDILMRGDEAGLGTPQEDLTSVAAVQQLDVPHKLVICVGFGVDAHHGICHAHYLEAVAALAREGGFLGAHSWVRDDPDVALFLEAVAFSSEQMPRSPSIVATSIASAIEGQYGDVHRTTRTQGSKLWINPLMSLEWAFRLDAVARRCLYLEEIKNTETAFEVSARIEAFRNARPTKDWEPITV